MFDNGETMFTDIQQYESYIIKWKRKHASEHQMQYVILKNTKIHTEKELENTHQILCWWWQRKVIAWCVLQEHAFDFLLDE